MFDQELAVQLGFACQYSYAASAFLTKRLKIADGQAPFSCRDDQQPPTSYATILTYADRRIVAFQGTITRDPADALRKPLDPNSWSFDALLDWLENFRLPLVTTDGMSFRVPGRVHQGFAHQLHMIYPKVLAELQKDRSTPVYVTGHSQGGAVGAIATRALATDGVPVRAAYTFASPRAGDAAFASSVTTEVHRIEFGDDIVPHVPMRTGLPAMFRLAVDRAAGAIGKAGEALKKVADLADLSYQAVGALSYAAPDMRPLFDLGPAAEADLATHRRTHLLFAGRNLVDHHHMFNYLNGVLGVDLRAARNEEVAAAVVAGGDGMAVAAAG